MVDSFYGFLANVVDGLSVTLPLLWMCQFIRSVIDLKGK